MGTIPLVRRFKSETRFALALAVGYAAIFGTFEAERRTTRRDLDRLVSQDIEVQRQWLDRLTATAPGPAMNGLQGRDLGLRLRIRNLRAADHRTTLILNTACLAWPVICYLPWAYVAVRRRRQAVRHRCGLCPACGYDLRATPDKCPECGTVSQQPAAISN